MTKAGLRTARRFGSQLPRFGDLAEAERVLYRRRDELRVTLVTASRGSSDFRPDHSPESLKALERWYVALLEREGFGALGIDRETLERAMAVYLGDVLVRNVPEFEWFVAEFAFEPGRYEIGVRRPLLSLMLSRQSFPPPERNRRHQSLWRKYLSVLPRDE